LIPRRGVFKVLIISQFRFYDSNFYYNEQNGKIEKTREVGKDPNCGYSAPDINVMPGMMA